MATKTKKTTAQEKTAAELASEFGLRHLRGCPKEEERLEAFEQDLPKGEGTVTVVSCRDCGQRAYSDFDVDPTENEGDD